MTTLISEKREYIERKIPHISNSKADNIYKVLKQTEVISIDSPAEETRGIELELLKEQTVANSVQI